MALPKWPSRLEPPQYDPPTVDPLHNPANAPKARGGLVWLGALALILAVLALLWWIGIPTAE